MGSETLWQDSKNRIFLMYHDLFLDSPDESGFVSRGANHYKIQASIFERQVKYVKEQHLESNVLFTFDDGGKSMYDLVAPILEKYGIHGVFCIPTDYIGKSHFLSKQQISDLYRRGHIIASHSDTHPDNMSLLNSKQHQSEWSNSIRVLSEIIETPVKVASIPNGFYSQEDIDILNLCEVSSVFTSSPSEIKHIKNTMVIGRYAVSNSTTWKVFTLIIRSPLYRSYLSIRQRFLDWTKRLLGFKTYSLIKKKLRLIWK